MDKLFSNVRFTLKYGDESLSFSAPMPKDRKQLATTLEQVASSLKADSKRVVGECDTCFNFIFEFEDHICQSQATPTQPKK